MSTATLRYGIGAGAIITAIVVSAFVYALFSNSQQLAKKAALNLMYGCYHAGNTELMISEKSVNVVNPSSKYRASSIIDGVTYQRGILVHSPSILIADKETGEVILSSGSGKPGIFVDTERDSVPFVVYDNFGRVGKMYKHNCANL